MKKYYIHKDNNQQGPFSAEELMELRITRDTMIWFEGAENWTAAGDVAELKELFKTIPPPFVAPKQPETPIHQAVGTSASRKKSKNRIILVSLLIVGLSALIYINRQAAQLEKQRNKQLEIRKLLKLQEEKIDQQERAEELLREQEDFHEDEQREAEKEARLTILKDKYDIALTNLRAASIKLEEVKKVKFLRTKAERQRQIEAQLEILRACEKEAERLRLAIVGM